MKLKYALIAILVAATSLSSEANAGTKRSRKNQQVADCQVGPIQCSPCDSCVTESNASYGFGGVSPNAPFGRDVDGAPLIGPPTIQKTRTVQSSGDPDDDLRIRELLQAILEQKLNVPDLEAKQLIEKYLEETN